jgi:hypothetical protein
VDKKTENIDVDVDEKSKCERIEDMDIGESKEEKMETNQHLDDDEKVKYK